MKKKCCKCKKEKPRDDFFNHKDRPDGKQSVCKKCSTENRDKRRMEKDWLKLVIG